MLVCQGLDKIVEIFKGTFPVFYAFPHSSIKPQLELSLSIHCSMIGKDQREFVFRIQTACDKIPGMGHLPPFFVPTPGYLPSKRNRKY